MATWPSTVACWPGTQAGAAGVVVQAASARHAARVAVRRTVDAVGCGFIGGLRDAAQGFAAGSVAWGSAAGHRGTPEPTTQFTQHSRFSGDASGVSCSGGR